MVQPAAAGATRSDSLISHQHNRHAISMLTNVQTSVAWPAQIMCFPLCVSLSNASLSAPLSHALLSHALLSHATLSLCASLLCASLSCASLSCNSLPLRLSFMRLSLMRFSLCPSLSCASLSAPVPAPSCKSVLSEAQVATERQGAWCWHGLTGSHPGRPEGEDCCS